MTLEDITAWREDGEDVYPEYVLKEQAKKTIKKVKEAYQITDDEMPKDILIDDQDRLTYSVSNSLSEPDKMRGISTIAWFMYFFDIEEVE